MVRHVSREKLVLIKRRVDIGEIAINTTIKIYLSSNNIFKDGSKNGGGKVGFVVLR